MVTKVSGSLQSLDWEIVEWNSGPESQLDHEQNKDFVVCNYLLLYQPSNGNLTLIINSYGTMYNSS